MAAPRANKEVGPLPRKLEEDDEGCIQAWNRDGDDGDCGGCCLGRKKKERSCRWTRSDCRCGTATNGGCNNNRVDDDDKDRENCWGANQFRTVVGRARIMMIPLCNIVIVVVGLVVVVVEDLWRGTYLLAACFGSIGTYVWRKQVTDEESVSMNE